MYLVNTMLCPFNFNSNTTAVFPSQSYSNQWIDYNNNQSIQQKITLFLPKKDKGCQVK